MVRVVRLERTVSWSQTRRDTNFAIPGCSLFCHDTTASGKNKVFSVCGHSCGQNRFCAVFGNRGKSRKRRCHKALRRFALPRPGYRHGTPKAGALPTALHPVIEFLSGWSYSPKASALPTALHPEIFIFTCAAIRCALLCSPGLRFPKKFSRYSPARFFRPLSVRYDNFNSIIDFLPEVNG